MDIEVENSVRPGCYYLEHSYSGFDGRAKKPERLGHKYIAANAYEYPPNHGERQPVCEPSETEKPKGYLEDAGHHHYGEGFGQAVGV